MRDHATKAQRRTKDVTQATITITAEVSPHLRQEHRWGSKEWVHAFAQRGAVESGYGNIKAFYGESFRRGWIRLAGLTATGLMLAFAIMHYNLRMLRSWAAKNDRTDDHETLTPDPEVIGYEPVSIDAALELADAARPPTAA